MSGRFSRTIYVGNLPSDIKEWEVEDLLYKYGRIVDIELKIPPRPPCYSFVEFESSRDAEDAIRGRDGYNFDGCHLRVELAHGGRGPSSSDRRSGYDRGSGGGRFGVSRHSEYRVIVRNLPSSASWQDLKDHMRRAGDVCFAEVSRDSEGTYGLVDYTNSDDMKYAIRKLDDTEFKNPWARTHIRVKYYDRSPSRSHSRSRSRSRSVRRNRRCWSRPSSFIYYLLSLFSSVFLASMCATYYSVLCSKSLERSVSKSVSRSVSRSRSPSPVKSFRPRSISRSRSESPRPARSGSA